MVILSFTEVKADETGGGAGFAVDSILDDATAFSADFIG
jgi:hypothetical protein